MNAVEHVHHPYANLCPCGQETTAERMARFSTLAAGWDGYDADPIDDRAIAAVVTFMDEPIRKPQGVIPCNNGGVRIDWLWNDLYIKWEPDGSIETAVWFPAEDSYDLVELDHPSPEAARAFIREHLPKE